MTDDIISEQHLREVIHSKNQHIQELQDTISDLIRLNGSLRQKLKELYESMPSEQAIEIPNQ